MDLGLMQSLQPGSRLFSCMICWDSFIPCCILALSPFFTVQENTFAIYIAYFLWFCQLWNLENYMVIRIPLWLGLWTYDLIFSVKTCGSESSVIESGVCFGKMPHCLQRLHYAHKQFETFLMAQPHSEHMILGLQIPSTLIWVLQYCLMPLIFPLMIKIIFLYDFWFYCNIPVYKLLQDFHIFSF